MTTSNRELEIHLGTQYNTTSNNESMGYIIYPRPCLRNHRQLIYFRVGQAKKQPFLPFGLLLGRSVTRIDYLLLSGDIHPISNRCRQAKGQSATHKQTTVQGVDGLRALLRPRLQPPAVLQNRCFPNVGERRRRQNPYGQQGALPAPSSTKGLENER